ncbi:hemicentin-1 isoform X2 [Patella vulgata]|uniref:hemicentin-1 isoform X2 n=1 Tax=Patella vulgata TaxID=6465 RepID=UPI00218045C2|nr:hemicentin-1 isoform X2 [Patella vulgata]
MTTTMTVNLMNTIHGLYMTILILVSMGWPHLTTARAARPQTYTLPTFVETERNVTFDVGDNARLPCSLQNLGPKVVIWKKVDQVHPISIGDYIYVPDSDYYVEHRETSIPSSEWNLRIKDVKIHHAGVYECQISAKEEIVRNITLNVVDSYKSNKPGIELGGTLFVEKGSEIKLKCSASAIDYLPLDVDWFKDGLKLRPNTESRVSISKYPSSDTNTLNSTLIIKHSNMTDAGTYVCRSSKRHIASLKVVVLNTGKTSVKRTFPDGPPDTEQIRTFNQGHTFKPVNVLTLFSYFICYILIIFLHGA